MLNQRLSLVRLSITPNHPCAEVFITKRNGKKILHAFGDHNTSIERIVGFCSESQVSPSTLKRFMKRQKLEVATRLDLQTVVRYETRIAQTQGNGYPRTSLIVAGHGSKTFIAVRAPAADGYSRQYTITRGWNKKTFPPKTLFLFCV